MASRTILAQFESKPYTLVLKLLARGSWEEKHVMLDNESHNEAVGIRDRLLQTLRNVPQEKRIDELMKLAPKNERTASYRKLCHKLVQQHS